VWLEIFLRFAIAASFVMMCALLVTRRAEASPKLGWEIFGGAMLAGAAICDHVVSFTMMRGGHIDITVLGAYQVSADGDLANWDTGTPDAIPAVGGAMDLAIGARQVWAMMEHATKKREPKIVERCTLPLTGERVVDRIYTDLARIDVTPQGLLVRAMVPGLDADTLQRLTAAPLRFDEPMATLSA